MHHHIPVLLKEVISVLDPKPGENFIDATLGGAGYTAELLKRTEPNGKILGIDLDEKAVNSAKKIFAKNKQVILIHGNFKDLDSIVKRLDFANIAGIVADLGFSSVQLDESSRGLSFQKKEVLDMRFDQTGEQVDAKFILNRYEENRLTEIFKKFGEERFSRQIAKKIIWYRTQNQEIKYTTQLYNIINSALPKPIKYKADDSARRIFQALRIAVNHELDNLQEFLPKAFALLKPQGRLAVVSFHSLEDRIVKQYFAGLSRGCVCPPDFPQCICGRNPQAKLLTKKAMVPSAEEIQANPRSKSAKLRAVIKI